MSKPLAAKLYMATPMGKNYQGGGEGILALPNGSGYLWLRNAIEKIIDMVAKCADNIILVGHVKDKAIVDSEDKVQGALKDFDMTGKWHYQSTRNIDQLLELGLFSNQISKKLNIDQYVIDLYMIEKFFDEKIFYPYTYDVVFNMLKQRHSGLSLKDIARDKKNMGLTPKKLFDKLHIRFNFSWKRIDSILTKELRETIVNKFKAKQAIYKIAQDTKLNESLISKFLHKELSDSDFIGFNIHYFDEINTEDKAYWLGFLYADGCVSSSTAAISLDLKSADIEHLIKFQEYLQARNNPRLQITEKYNRCRFIVGNKLFHDNLVKLGCTPRKSLTLKFPTFISDDLIRHFIRGYFDGDGTISYSCMKDNKVTISCAVIGTKEFLEGMADVLLKYGITGTSKLLHPDSKNSYNMSFSKTNSVKLSIILYSQSTIYLTRKYKRYEFFRNNNFAVQKSDFLNNDRAISEEMSLWANLNKDRFATNIDSEIIFNKVF